MCEKNPGMNVLFEFLFAIIFLLFAGDWPKSNPFASTNGDA